MDKKIKTGGCSVMLCGCTHKYQDRVYGEHHRVYNQTAQSAGSMYRCTVCGNLKAK